MDPTDLIVERHLIQHNWSEKVKFLEKFKETINKCNCVMNRNICLTAIQRFIFYSMQMQLLKKLSLPNLPSDSESFIIAGVIWRNKTCVVLTVLDNFFPNLSISCTVWLPKKKGLTDRGNSWSAIFLSFSVCLPAFLPLLPFWLYALLKEKYAQCFFGVWFTSHF